MLTLSHPNLPTVLEAAYASFAGLASADADGFGPAETPIGFADRDRKRYLEFDGTGAERVPAPLRDLRDLLCGMVDSNLIELGEVLLPTAGVPLRKLMDVRRGPVLRLSLYPAGGAGEVNQAHTDIDLFTLLPSATQSGLQTMRDGVWSSAAPGPTEVMVLPGDIMSLFGGMPAVRHRVVTDGSARISASLFVNADGRLEVEDGRLIEDLVAERLRAVRRPEGGGAR